VNWIQKKIVLDFPANEPHLVGVSGGRDSVALLHQLVDAGYGRLIICHLNHNLRGRSSAADARFVERLAGRLHLDVAIGATNVRSLATRNKVSIETAAREARYHFFAQVAKRQSCRSVFLGHHADDLVETFLMNLFRGAGLSGLGSIREIATQHVDGLDLIVVRPLLRTWRREIDAYVRAGRLKFREDASNKDLVPLRNRVRRRVIPYLERVFGRNIRQNIWRTAAIAAEEEDFFETLLPGKLNATALAVEPLGKMPAAVQRRIVRKWLQASAVQDVSFDLIERVRSLFDLTSRAAKTNLPRDRHVRRRAGKIFLE
jgi:tRNA(Ile)-lysidine synthase